MKKHNKGFTLVELIITMIILIVLSTIGFIKYSDYIASSRDSTRYSQLQEISDLLKTYKIEHTLPVPYNFIKVKALGETIGYQGYAGVDILDKIHYSSQGKDPKDYKFYTYYITSDRKSFELMGFFEDETSLKLGNLSDNVDAIDYKIRYPFVIGDKIGVLTDTDNTPIQEVKSFGNLGYVDLTNNHKDDTFKAYITNNRVYTFSGKILDSKLYTITHKGKFGAPNNCPEGYISVWGDVDFNQKGFCVAKYEMTFSEKDSPGTPTNSSYNAYDYVSGKYYKSRVDYPVVNLTQQEAIEACKKLGKGYHLITNNEWMTIARQIEFESENWQNRKPGENDTLFNGNSKDNIRGCNDDTGPKNKGTKTGDGNVNYFNKRKNILFNGEIIWDFAGNVAEHVNKANTKSGSGYNNGKTKLYKKDGSSTNETWEEFGNLNNSAILSYGPLIGKYSSNGVGKIYDLDGKSNNIFIRGGSFDDRNATGIYTLILNKDGNNKENNIGFRCAR